MIVIKLVTLYFGAQLLLYIGKPEASLMNIQVTTEEAQQSVTKFMAIIVMNLVTLYFGAQFKLLQAKQNLNTQVTTEAAQQSVTKFMTMVAMNLVTLQVQQSSISSKYYITAKVFVNCKRSSLLQTCKLQKMYCKISPRRVQ